MNLELLKKVLQCNHCKSDELNFNDVCLSNPLKPQGKIICANCKKSMDFRDGVLITDKKQWTSNQTRNAYVYSDFWQRSDDAYKYNRITHEDELIIDWRKNFNEGIFLDAGCGSGRHLFHWTHPEVLCDALVLVDISNSIFQCREYYESLNTNKPAIFIQCSVSELPIKSKVISSLWSSGVIGLLENQKKAIGELCRVTKGNIHIGVLSEKTLAGKMYLAANFIKPIFNRVKSMNILFMLAGFLSRMALLVLKIIYKLNLDLSFIRKTHLKNILNDPNSVERLKHSLYDPIIIPKIVKYKDINYIKWVSEGGFTLDSHETELICDYYSFIKR